MDAAFITAFIENPITSLIAFLAGLLPTLFWLFFWLREDRKNPEPVHWIAITFIGGMLMVPVAIYFQDHVQQFFFGQNRIFIWVIIEEVLKFAVALAVILWSKAVDEPIDLIIYMITVALGFAALENAFFIFNPLLIGDATQAIISGHIRFVGATLLHVLASGVIGATMAMVYYHNSTLQIVYGIFGLFIAIILHVLFNFFILNATGGVILWVFFFVWIGLIMLMLLFEKTKRLRQRHERQ